MSSITPKNKDSIRCLLPTLSAHWGAGLGIGFSSHPQEKGFHPMLTAYLISPLGSRFRFRV